MPSRDSEERWETVPAEDLGGIRELYRRGLYLKALKETKRFGPLRDWTGTEERILAGQLVWNLGARGMCQRLHLRAWRDDPENPHAIAMAGRTIHERLGPLSAWEFIRAQSGTMEAAGPAPRVSWLIFVARTATAFRDFDTAESALAQSESLSSGDETRIWGERALLLESQDRYEESVQAARRAYEGEPRHPFGTLILARAFLLTVRDAEALEILADAAPETESWMILSELAELQSELGHREQARATWERAFSLCPLREPYLERWFAGRRSDAAYLCGDLAGAFELARRAHHPFFDKIAERLSVERPSGGTGADRRVQLAVGFVRQHHVTCAPATLTAISRYWSQPADHLEVAEQICYDGTPAHSERTWAERNGWRAREFTVSWDSATALLDKGIPFTLATVGARLGHLQAVMGYDALRGTLLIRDPYHPGLAEMLGHEFLEREKLMGSRGMALVPLESASLLERVDLPHAAEWDRLYALQDALASHDRPAAHEIYRAMSAHDPDHPLTLRARQCLAAYDTDTAGILACAERILQLYPDETRVLVARLSCLRELGHRDERLALLREICARPTSDPVFLQMYASELSDDAREFTQAETLLRRIIRRGLQGAAPLRILSGILWTARRFEDSLELARLAACLEDKDEGHAMFFFHASREKGKGDAALGFLESRVRRLGRLSGRPAMTLFAALCRVDRVTRAFEVIEGALALRPDDGELLLYAADAFGRSGEFDQSARLLARADGRAKRSDWLRASATIASYRGDLAAALTFWKEVLAVEPLALDANREIAILLEATKSRAAAQGHLRAVVERFPHNSPLQRLRIERLREEDPADAVAALQALIEVNSVDVWARRELALRLGEMKRFDEAEAELEIATLLNPSDAWTWSIRGYLHRLAGKEDESKEACRRAIRLSADATTAISQLVSICRTAAERREALGFIRDELGRQVSTGEGLLTYREQAAGTLDPDELLAVLQERLHASPDLWRTHSAVIRQLTDMKRYDEAFEISREAVACFPLEPSVWVDRAHVCQLRSDAEGEVEALRRALHISPSRGDAVRRLAALHERMGDIDSSKKLLEQAVAASPLDPLNHAWLADVMRMQGDMEGATQRMEHALILDPRIDWAWRRLIQCWAMLGKPERVRAFARDLSSRRSGDPATWSALVNVLTAPEDRTERIAASDRALALSPRSIDVHDQRVVVLAEAGDFERALEACRPPALGPVFPLELRGRAAWVEAARGNTRRAIEQMKVLLGEEERYVWGWSQLVAWYRSTGDMAAYLSAAEKLVDLVPHDSAGLATRGAARLANHDRQKARHDFHRALELAPESSTAAAHLFDILIEEGDLEEAKRTITLVRGHVHPAWILSSEVRLAAARQDRTEADRAFRALCRSRFDALPLLEKAAEAYSRRWSSALDDILDEVLDHPDVNPLIARLWIQRRAVIRGDWRACTTRMVSLMARGEIGSVAARAFLEALTEMKARRRMRAFVQRHQLGLKKDIALWAAVLLGHTSLTLLKDGARWGSDWDRRSGLEPWMLSNLVICLRGIGRDEEAARVSHRALSLPPDATSVRHSLWLAVDEAVGRATSSADSRLAAIDVLELDRFDRFLHGLAHAVVDVQKAPAGQVRQVHRRARKEIDAVETFVPNFRNIRSLRRAHKRCIASMIQRGGFVGVAWYLARLLRA